MDKEVFSSRRKSYMDLGGIFFWTATINKWQRLLEQDIFKDIIINSLSYLSVAGKIDVFAFVIMPNHIHLIWRINELNGKESTQASFLKYTAHEFKKYLIINDAAALNDYSVDASNKKYEFWQRDSLAVNLYTEKVAYQKLDYLHYNSCSKHWELAKDPADYLYSSAGYYMKGEKSYSFIKDLRLEF